MYAQKEVTADSDALDVFSVSLLFGAFCDKRFALEVDCTPVAVDC
jgi:hypothetical protein